jgi:hypothetical protein
VSNPSNLSLGSLNVFAGSGGNTFTINANTPSVITTVNTSAGKDRVTLLQGNNALSLNDNGTNNTLVGPNYNTTWVLTALNSGRLSDGTVIYGYQNLVGGAGNNTFQFFFSGGVSGTLTGGGRNTLDYSQDGGTPVTVNLQTHAATGTAGFGKINAVVGSSNTANKLIGANTTNQWVLTGANAGTVNGFAFSGMPHLVGGTGVDVFKFNSPSATVLSISGGGAPAHQGDWLDYSSSPSTSIVTVNLATGSASNVNGGAAGAVTGIQDVIGTASGTNKLTGSSQGNILIGGSGANTLIGGSGNSLLIGGGGHGSLTGGTGQDILIAGTTTYNATTAAGRTSLMAILAELQSADTFAQKVYDLIHGNNLGSGSDLNGSNKLTWGVTGATVTPSSGAFTLSGDLSAASTADWFFSNAFSAVKDFNDDGVKDEHNNNSLGVF